MPRKSLEELETKPAPEKKPDAVVVATETLIGTCCVEVK